MQTFPWFAIGLVADGDQFCAFRCCVPHWSANCASSHLRLPASLAKLVVIVGCLLLLQVNSSPSLACENELDSAIKPRLISDVIK